MCIRDSGKGLARAGHAQQGLVRKPGLQPLDHLTNCLGLIAGRFEAGHQPVSYTHLTLHQLSNANLRLAELNRRDGLTGLFNRQTLSEAVSYTHLDVYKRQRHHWPPYPRTESVGARQPARLPAPAGTAKPRTGDPGLSLIHI